MGKFKAVVSRMGRKRVINVPAKQKGFEIGDSVVVNEA